MVRYYGRARQRTASVNTNQLGLKMSGCPSKVGRRGSIDRYIMRRSHCSIVFCGPVYYHDVIWRTNYAINPETGAVNWRCIAPAPLTRALAGGVGRYYSPRLRCNCKGSHEIWHRRDKLHGGSYTIVETIPSNLSVQPIYHTYEVLMDLVEKATLSLDILSSTWNLLGGESLHGPNLLAALNAAANRGVYIRIVQFVFAGKFADPAGGKELQSYQGAHPGTVTVNLLCTQGAADLFGKPSQTNSWTSSFLREVPFIPPTTQTEDYQDNNGSIWIADEQSFYIGSASPSWPSLSAHKELGILVEAHGDIGLLTCCRDLTNLYNCWWQMSSPIVAGITLRKNGIVQLPASMTISGKKGEPPTITSFNQELGFSVKSPDWAATVPIAQRRTVNLATFGIPLPKGNWQTPMQVNFGGVYSSLLFTQTPSFATQPTRTDQLLGIVNTIVDAQEYVNIAMPNFPDPTLKSNIVDTVGQIRTVWWGDLYDAILKSVFSKGVNVRLLISTEATVNTAISYLQELVAMAEIIYMPGYASGSSVAATKIVQGSLEIRRLPLSRLVNSARFIVTEKRANVGTATWSYTNMFIQAGTSLNTTNASIIASLNEIFIRDWNSAS